MSTNPDAVATPPNATFDRSRLLSLDALRGLDMLLIIGIEKIIHGLRPVSKDPVVVFLLRQFNHKEWEGFSMYDLIFPLLVFLVGISLVFSLSKVKVAGGTRSVIVRLFRRAVVLFLLGVFYYGGMANGWHNIRWMGVLQRIAIAYFFAALVYLGCGRNAKRVAAVFVLILVLYWALLTFIPIPGQDHVSLKPGENLTNYLDQLLLPGRLHNKTWDPEGLLSSLPAVATCLLGVLTGLLFANENLSPQKKALWLFVGGAALLGTGFLWGLEFPIIKKIWTSSYVLVAGGYSLLLMGLFYLVIDVWQFRRGIAPLVWVGSNALTMYLIGGFVDFSGMANRLVGGEIKGWIAPWDHFLIAIVSMALIIALAGFMYRRRIFIRV